MRHNSPLTRLQADILRGGVAEESPPLAVQARTDASSRTMSGAPPPCAAAASVSQHHQRNFQHLEGGGDLLEHLSGNLGMVTQLHHLHHHHHLLHGEPASDPRELEAFAERFRQRRVKLGVTQADVGAALASLNIAGVGALSQSTICRFESLTLSRNNMTALKPVLHAWLEEAEAARREPAGAESAAGSPDDDDDARRRRRRRTSIAAPEKRSLEAYFAIQPRPSSEKMAAIAQKLELKKNVVRVWFCNQRQKQKRMKYSAAR
ncbi:POU domain, class 4, transcription factor 3 [Festucalex cinctus]